MGTGLEKRLRAAVDELPDGLREHVYRVETEAVRLAVLHGLDVDRARWAALGHDLLRHKVEPPQAFALAQRYGITPDEIELATPVLLHGRTAARLLVVDFGVDDADVLAAVDCHTTGRAGMSRLEKLLFIADKIEEHKVAAYPEWQEVRRLADTDLDAALLRFLDLHVERAVRLGWLLHPRSIEARNELLLSRA
jgi:predicted HD superfamily hydrolase involved in NAD metabolism